MYEFIVSGMTCGGCVNSVSRAIQSLDSKAEVNVDLKSQLVKVKSLISKDEIKLSIEDAGFPVLETRQVE